MGRQIKEKKREIKDELQNGTDFFSDFRWTTNDPERAI
jgi:hypothetical protein